MSARARLHLMPIVMTAAAALLGLKAVGLATHTSYLFASPAAASTAEPSKPEPSKAETSKAETSKPEDGKPAQGSGHGGADAPAAAGDAKVVRTMAEPPPPDVSPSERPLLEALVRRREAIDARAGDLDLRENLLKAAERRLEERLAELKRLEAQVSAADGKREEQEKTRLKQLVTMYESMKVKEAARIFDRLDAAVLLDVASRMNPRKLSDVLGQMTPDAAETLTVALARREVGPQVPAAMAAAAPTAASDLPKIEGRPASR